MLAPINHTSLIYALISSIIWAVVCYYMARRRGRDVYYALSAGLVFGIFAILYYFIVGDSKALRSQKSLEKPKKQK
jgi:cytochrome bd-type quinol oxidase subunit 1